MKLQYYLPIFIILLLPFLSTGQVSFDKYFIVKTGIAGKQSKVNNNTARKMEVVTEKPGFDYSVGVGIDINFFKSEQFQISTGILYNNQTFSKEENRIWQSFTNPEEIGIVSNTTETYKIQRISMPLMMGLKFKKLKLYSGLIAAYNIRTQRAFGGEYKDERDQSVQIIERIYKSGDSYEAQQFHEDSYRTELKRNIEFQALVGVDFEIVDKISLGIEYRTDLTKNVLYHIINMSDVIGPYTQGFDLNTHAFNLVLKKQF